MFSKFNCTDLFANYNTIGLDSATGC